MPLLLLLLLTTASSWPWAAAAQDAAAPVVLEGQRFAPRATVAGANLVLNGTGLRAVAWFKGFAAGLYLRERVSTAEQVLAVAGPKRLQLRMLQTVPSAELAKAVRKGVQRNAAEADLPKLESALAQLEAQILALPKVRKGDVVDLDHDGANALVLSVNGAARGPAVASKILYPALLLAFVGEHPYDRELRAGLLGQPGPAR